MNSAENNYKYTEQCQQPNISSGLWDHYTLHGEPYFGRHGDVQTRHEGYGDNPTSQDLILWVLGDFL